MSISLNVGALLSMNGKTYRVISHLADTQNRQCIQMIATGSKKLDLKTMVIDDLFQEQIFQATQEECHVRLDCVSDAETQKAQLMKSELEKILAECKSNFQVLCNKQPKPEIERRITEAAQKQGVSKRTVWRKLIAYLESGYDICSLYNRRPTNRSSDGAVRGRKVKLDGPDGSAIFAAPLRMDEKMEEAFTWGRKRLSADRSLTMKAVYVDIIRKFYSEYDNKTLSIVKLPKEMCPTYLRFVRWMHKNDPKSTCNRGITALEEPLELHGTAAYDLRTIGERFEVDECEFEMDVVMIDKERLAHVIGSPVVYFLVDELTRCIVAYAVSLKNNSYSGFLNLMSTMISKKSTVLPKDLSLLYPDIDDWFPGCILPKTIRCDHGSEYTSKNFYRAMTAAKDGNIFSTLGVAIELVPVGRGERKGIVENIHKVFQKMVTDSVGTKSGIKRQNQLTKDHAKYACFTMEDMHKITLNFIKVHNTRKLTAYNEYTDELRDVELSPIGLWTYYQEHSIGLIEVTEQKHDLIYYELLSGDISFSLRKGMIVGGGLYYLPDKYFSDLAKTHSETISIPDMKYDPRFVDCVFRLEKGKLVRYPLAQKFGKQRLLLGTPWAEAKRIMKDLKGKLATDEDKLLARMDFQGKLDDIHSVAKSIIPQKANVKEIREHRKEAEALEDVERSIRQTMPSIENDLYEDPETKEDTACVSDTPQLPELPAEEAIQEETVVYPETETIEDLNDEYQQLLEKRKAERRIKHDHG